MPTLILKGITLPEPACESIRDFATIHGHTFDTIHGRTEVDLNTVIAWLVFRENARLDREAHLQVMLDQMAANDQPDMSGDEYSET